MVLSDTDLRTRLGELSIETSNPVFGFSAEKQIQPCSIDLRLSDLVWIPKKGGSLDLSDAAPLGPNLSRRFVRQRIRYPKGLRLRPGQFVLGRTYEKFSIPNDLMGLLVGRSSFGRLGLSVSSQSNLINPGWSGHMPLVIRNNSPFTLVIHPYIGIVQLCLHVLSSAPGAPYGVELSKSKYVNDDGGPSRYWLDVTIADLQTNSESKSISAKDIGLLERYSAELDEATRGRFLAHIGSAKPLSGAEALVETFASKEQRRAPMILLGTAIVGIPLAILTGDLATLWREGPWTRAIAGLLAVAVVAGFGWLAWLQFGTSMAVSDLRRIAGDVGLRARKP